VHQLEIKVLDIVDARCNHEVYAQKILLDTATNCVSYPQHCFVTVCCCWHVYIRSLCVWSWKVFNLYILY